MFSDARGFGINAIAGRGGQVIKVTNLNPQGPGSLQEALYTKGPRIIVFEVGGIIDMKMERIVVLEPYVTIAGQTAPSPGITIIRGNIHISTHDVLVQHIAVRPGDGADLKKQNWEPDALSTSGACYNVIVDHCSVSWSIDEGISFSGNRTGGPLQTTRFSTISNCIIAEELSNATHSKGEHSKGTLIHDFCQYIAVIGNLYAHNNDRNPYFKAFTTGVVVNNFIYNPGESAMKVRFVHDEWSYAKMKPENARVAFVGNVFIAGVNTAAGLPMIDGWGDIYVNDNITSDGHALLGKVADDSLVLLDAPYVWPKGFVAKPASETAHNVLSNAGMRPWDRDPVDQRIITVVAAGRGKIINSQDEVGGYPKYTMTTRKLEVPEGVDLHDWAVNFKGK